MALLAPQAAFAAPDHATPLADTDAAAAGASPTQTPPKDGELTDIVVTATRSGAESLQKVPIAVSVVNVDQVT
ncbi:hypothetical protein DSM05_16050, partial [Pseudomonas sp. FW305-3-2-15-E-TSA4]|nr:hypothetical protein [Pseudomonas sp. FW305-3-2-15-E-TSA4]